MGKTHKYDVGYRQTNKQNLIYEVIQYKNHKDVDVKFDDGLVLEHIPVTRINQNTLMHPHYPIPQNNKTPKDKRLGEVRKNTQGRNMTIVAYRNVCDIDIQFDNGFVVEHIQYQLFERGTILDPFYPSLYGVGYMGMRTKYKESKRYAKQYEVWSSMMKRCYNKNCTRHAWYEDCEVAEEWHNFSTFLKWYDEHYYTLPEGMGTVDLDKDIKVQDCRIYGPDTCLLVPDTINRMLYHRITSKSKYPLGVSYDKKRKKYLARGHVDKEDVYFGSYDTVEEAFIRVKEEKEKEIRKYAKLYKPYMPDEVYQAIINYEIKASD